MKLLYAGIDLHANNNYLGISDEENQKIFKKKIPNDLDTVLHNLNPFKESLVGVVVESTFNWYWLVDGLMDNGYKVHLANPAAIKQYEGLKYMDDKWDAFWLANMLRLNILPEGYIYPKKERPLRDLLRKRLMLVRQRTSHVLSLKGMFNRNLALNMPGNRIKALKEEEAKQIFDQPQLIIGAKASISIMRFLTKQIEIIEKEVRSKLSLRKEFKKLLSVHGIGEILGMTIMLEVGDIRRFTNVRHYSSYCRCVSTYRLSNGKSKGRGNGKNGNKYLSWAYIEAANHMIRYCPYARAFYQRKLKKSGNSVAIKALGNKISKATYYIMRDQTKYDPRRLFN